MKKINYKVEFIPGDLIVDLTSVKSGLIVEVSKKHIKVLWDDTIEKISKWEANRRLLVQEYQYFSVAKNKTKKM